MQYFIVKDKVIKTWHNKVPTKCLNQNTNVKFNDSECIDEAQDPVAYSFDRNTRLTIGYQLQTCALSHPNTGCL